MGSWSLTIGFINGAGNRIELTHSYTLTELVALAREQIKSNPIGQAKSKLKLVPTWILSDVSNAAAAYFERGFNLEKMEIKRGD